MHDYWLDRSSMDTSVFFQQSQQLCLNNCMRTIHLQGRIFIEPTLPELSAQERAAAYRQQATTLAALHSVRPEEVGLQRYGRPAGYCARQVSQHSTAKC